MNERKGLFLKITEILFLNLMLATESLTLGMLDKLLATKPHP